MNNHNSQSRFGIAPQAFAVAATCFALLALASPASAQIIVDGQNTGTVIQGRPVQRTYAQAYPPQNRARLITRQSVIANGGSIPPVQYAQYAPYVQQPLTPPPGAYTSPGPATITVEEFRVDPYSSRRYRNSYYPAYSYELGGRYHYPYYYGGYNYSFRPSLYRFNYCRPTFGHSHRGSFFRFSSSCGASFRFNF